MQLRRMIVYLPGGEFPVHYVVRKSPKTGYDKWIDYAIEIPPRHVMATLDIGRDENNFEFMTRFRQTCEEECRRGGNPLPNWGFVIFRNLYWLSTSGNNVFQFVSNSESSWTNHVRKAKLFLTEATAKKCCMYDDTENAPIPMSVSPLHNFTGKESRASGEPSSVHGRSGFILSRDPVDAGEPDGVRQYVSWDGYVWTDDIEEAITYPSKEAAMKCPIFQRWSGICIEIEEYRP